MNVVRELQVAGLANYLRAVQLSSSVSVSGASGASALVAFWHDAMLALLAATAGTPNVAIYLRAQPFLEDMLNLLAKLGVPAFVSDHRGTATIKAARQWLTVPGRILAITLDVGQPHVGLPGVARLARMLGVPVHPLAVSASRGYRAPHDRTVVPHLGAELSVRVHPAISGASPEDTALSLQNALAESTLSQADRQPSVPWRRMMEPWPRACMAPRTRGTLKVWPATQAAKISF